VSGALTFAFAAMEKQFFLMSNLNDTPFPVRLIDSLASTEALADVFSDHSVLRAMLDFEAALARAEGRLGVIPASAASVIDNIAKNFPAGSVSLSREAARAGTPAIPLVKMLTDQVRLSDSAAAGFVHWGATSQDVTDTALVLLLDKARSVLKADQSRLDVALRSLSDKHASTIMLGRTLLQPAPPVTFGLKAAGWLAATRRGWSRLDAAFSEALVLQFGGAAGTLASLGDQGGAVAELLARELGLALPDAPWHAHRDRLAALVAACGVQTGSLGKMARDLALLMQTEVDEASEPGIAGRGGSSTMPHKRNPIACSLTLAAANRVPGLVAAFLSGMVQEHERGVGGVQAEWSTVSAVIQSFGVALSSMAEVSEGLEVNAKRMADNIKATRGVIFSERIMMILGKSMGRDIAYKLLEKAVTRCADENRRLVDVLAEMPEVTAHLTPREIHQMDSPEAYLGEAERFRKLLVSSREKNPK
jgi:3-carboxy-cis,cis-muconate cycloisomerase